MRQYIHDELLCLCAADAMETEVLRDSSQKRSRAEPIDEIEMTAIAEAMLGLGPASRTSSPDGSEEPKEAKPEKTEEESKSKPKAQPKKKRKVSKVWAQPFSVDSPSHLLISNRSTVFFAEWIKKQCHRE